MEGRPQLRTIQNAKDGGPRLREEALDLSNFLLAQGIIDKTSKSCLISSQTDLFWQYSRHGAPQERLIATELEELGRGDGDHEFAKPSI